MRVLDIARSKEATDDISNNTGRTTRSLYVKSLGTRLVSAHAWFGMAIRPYVLEKAGMKEKDPPIQAPPDAAKDASPEVGTAGTAAESSAQGGQAGSLAKPAKQVSAKVTRKALTAPNLSSIIPYCSNCDFSQPCLFMQKFMFMQIYIFHVHNLPTSKCEMWRRECLG